MSNIKELPEDEQAAWLEAFSLISMSDEDFADWLAEDDIEVMNNE